MKRSIRIKLFFVFLGVMVLLVLSEIILNSLFLEKFYLIKNKSVFEQTAESVELFQYDSDIDNKIQEISYSNGTTIIIADSNYKILYSSVTNKRQKERLNVGIRSLLNSDNDNSIYTTTKNKEEKPNIIYAKKLSDGNYLILTKSLAFISESSSVANQFFLFTGIFVVVVGSIFIFIFTSKLLEPIVKMNKIAKSMCDLNFDEHIQVKSKDEIGELSQSINVLSDKLKESISGLKNDIEFQKTLSRNMSHELKTPIGVIKGYAEGLSYEIADSAEKRKKYVDVIVNESDRMDGLVKEILELSRLNASNYKLQDISEFSSKEIEKTIKERFNPAFAENCINFSSSCKDIIIKGDFNLLLRAISNLISNAIKYGDANKYISLNIFEGEQNIKICIFNTGDSIPEAEIPKLFDAFYRVDTARTPNNNTSHGLGLAIVKSIVELHGGKILILNVDNGVTATLYLPK